MHLGMLVFHIGLCTTVFNYYFYKRKKKILLKKNRVWFGFGFPLIKKKRVGIRYWCLIGIGIRVYMGESFGVEFEYSLPKLGPWPSWSYKSSWILFGSDSAIWEGASNLRKMSLEQWKELNKCGGLSLLETLSLAQIAETFKSSKTFGSLY